MDDRRTRTARASRGDVARTTPSRGTAGCAGAAGTLATLLAIALAGCTAITRITDPTTPDCQQSLRDGFDQILAEEGEMPERASTLAADAATTLAGIELGPRPFALSSPSGADYLFFFERADEGCLLRLYGKQKGFWSYTNDLTYIATRTLPGCGCEE